ncbi:unnamed protein product [Rotaria magnacalcarata]|uniref:Uncharacterized protein n=1 Tax=Rotaria magnacalcarata TaxID=392030 RepID=A0A816TQ35_9BILA|nr:unnamed protein product [Rotaria magnacalcarata]CAF3979405.1 unnamed protein product [Rotaria magnacalcarata]
MATSMNKDIQQKKSTVGFLLIIGEIISNEQRDEICVHLKQAFKKIDDKKYHEINDLFNNLIHGNEFQADSQYRQISETENGSVAGFIYLPSYHTVLNVLKDIFHSCYHVSIIYCGQQIDSNGALILSDSLFTCDNFYSVFEDQPSYVIQDLQLLLPFVSNQWTKLSSSYLAKKLDNIQINDLSDEIDQDNLFGRLFYERLIQLLTKDSINFDIYTKLIPRDSSGTIAFDEPNLYIFYGQQGEASLFGVRGFVVLINGGFSRVPSYWNLIRGLQNIDACILTHFDYNVLPGLQTILHRKVISEFNGNQPCKPDIGTMFLNHIQRTKIQAINGSKASSNSKLLIHLPDNINQFSNDIKKLNIDTLDLVLHSTASKTTIEPINLFKKIAFGSLDMYVLHPVAPTTEYDKALTALQKISIRDREPSSSIIPLHHWYSSCLLLVWTPSSKSGKDTLVRILYTGACPQTLVFEALNRVRHLEILHVSEQQQKSHKSNTKITSSVDKNNVDVKSSPQKPKTSHPVTNRVVPSTVQSRVPKVLPQSTNSKPKVSQTKVIKSEKSRSPTMGKKTIPPTLHIGAQSNSRDKKIQKPLTTDSKIPATKNETKNHVQKLEVQGNQQEKLEIHNEHQEVLDGQNEHQEGSNDQKEHQETSDGQNEHQNGSSNQKEHQETTDGQNEQQDGSNNQKEHQETSDGQNEHQENLEAENNEQEQSNEVDENSSFRNHIEEQRKEENQPKMSPDEFDENNQTSIDDHEDGIRRPEFIPLTSNLGEPLVESHTESPMIEIQSELVSGDPMTTGFIDGTSNTTNPFISEENDNHNTLNNDDKVEIMHHDISRTDEHSISSTDDINPQGLPVENNVQSIKPTIKRLSNSSNRTSETSKSTNTTTQASLRKPKQTPLSDSIYNVDVAYIPFHGDQHYVDDEFFRRVRARYYILNAVQINHLTLESLIHGKEQWENKEHVPVSLVPTFDGEQLRQFFVMNKDRLAELNITILPASIRCNVQYDDEASPAQILRFSSIFNNDEQ